ncbi:MAG: hypothetical protein SX243_10005 [Acidobacteriota bacterium]|nr:hypothetical protein [Acidobacteriota bacterium]
MHRFAPLLRFLFVQYCMTAGILLVVIPWSRVWDRLVLEFAQYPFFPFLQLPHFRAAVAGFGLVHFVWGIHDLYLLLSRRELDHGESAS